MYSLICSILLCGLDFGSYNINQKLLSVANKGYEYAKSHNITHSSIMIIADYSQPSVNKRLWLVDMESRQVIANSYVAHGLNSGVNFATSFSNNFSSKKSSLGFFVTHYNYIGSHGKSIKLKGLEKNINDNAFKRGLVIHSANYVNENTIDNLHRLGRSWGCLAVDRNTLNKILEYVKEPSLVLSYYPDAKWMNKSKLLI